MFNQFLGNYLMNEGIITKEQLLVVLEKKRNTKIKLGTLAVNRGYMTYEQVEKIHQMQKTIDKKIGDIAVDCGYLTYNQVLELLSYQVPEYLLLGQALINEGFISEKDFTQILNSYKRDYAVLRDDNVKENNKVVKLLEQFYDFSNIMSDEKFFRYLLLLMKNLIRFIGDDFSISNISREKLNLSKRNYYQDIKEKVKITSVYSSDDKVLLNFAKRFAGIEFETFNEYVDAAICDFINLHNGLFIVNISNKMGIELTLTPPQKLEQEVEGICINISYPFGDFKFFVII